MNSVHFACHVCSTQFDIPTEYLLRKEKVECPSCGSDLPDDVLSSVKDCVTAYSKAYEVQKKYLSSAPLEHLTFRFNLE